MLFPTGQQHGKYCRCLHCVSHIFAVSVVDGGHFLIYDKCPIDMDAAEESVRHMTIKKSALLAGSGLSAPWLTSCVNWHGNVALMMTSNSIQYSKTVLKQECAMSRWAHEAAGYEIQDPL